MSPPTLPHAARQCLAPLGSGRLAVFSIAGREGGDRAKVDVQEPADAGELEGVRRG